VESDRYIYAFVLWAGVSNTRTEV